MHASSEVLKDLQELEQLAGSCKRPRVKAVLDAYVEQLRACGLGSADDKPVEVPAPMEDEYGKEPNCVYIYITSGLDGVGECKERVSCDFGKNSVDLKIHDLNGKNYRLVLNNLDKDIDPDQSKAIVKKNNIKLKLRKVKGTYGYDSWIDLKAKRAKDTEKNADPSAGLMDMMKQMYDEGDDNMKKTLGEAMLKSRQGQAMGGGGPSMDDF